jgi:hypothetical protein
MTAADEKPSTKGAMFCRRLEQAGQIPTSGPRNSLSVKIKIQDRSTL